MKTMLRLLLIGAGIASADTVWAQLKVTTKASSDGSTGRQVVQAIVSGGSGNYTYAWGVDGSGVVPENSSSAVLTVPAQAAEYVVFVRDKKTGSMGYASVAVAAPEPTEKHLIRMPGEGNGSKHRYMPMGALQSSSPKK